MPKEEQMTQLEEKTFYELAKEQYHLSVPLLRTVPGSEEQAYAPCIVLSGLKERKCKLSAQADTLRDFGGKYPDKTQATMWDQILEDNYAAWVVYEAFRQPGNLKANLFISKDQLTNDFTAEEIGIFYSNYTTTKLNHPSIKHLNQENNPNALSEFMDTIISQATVEQTSFFLTSYTTVSLAMLIRYLTEEVKTLRHLNGLSSTPLSDTESNQ
jgi:hypothetical protein